MARRKSSLSDAEKVELDFNIRATRGFLFKTAKEMLDGILEQKVPNAAAAVLHGAIEFAALAWMQTMLKSGYTRKEAREQAEAEFRKAVIKHGKEIYADPQEPN